MVKEWDIGRRNDDGIGAVGQLRALDDRNLIETVLRARCGRPDIILPILHIHGAVLRIGGKLSRLVITLFRHRFLDNAPMILIGIVCPGVLDPWVFFVGGTRITIIGVYDPALVNLVCCRALIDTAGDKTGLVAGQADEVKARAAEGELGSGPASALRIGIAADGGLYRRAERIGGAGIISAVVSIDIVRVAIGELEIAGTILALIGRLFLSCNLPASVKGHKAVLIVDRCRGHDGDGAVAVPRVPILLTHDRIGEGFRLIHHHSGLGIGDCPVSHDLRGAVGSINSLCKPIRQRIGGAQIFRDILADARKGNRARHKRSIVGKHMDIHRQAVVNDRNIFCKRRKTHKPCIIGGILHGYIGKSLAPVGKHILAYCVALGIIPAHKQIVPAGSSGGADGLFRSIHIFVSVKNADGIVGNILPFAAVP